ncbi:hypothetical protein E4T66_18020 [Sinimarinibacterium sp. CAU 1509]|uniref:Calx-beta domain-containing protein n=1 Tax=Sinimarinibacterium sp. CAU 1509 TaxID=2562283 RepID=UPI0010AD07F0|nr:hypothetical protein [Sinimarinibacterium sp. CAU 1509]TJY57303.1 hypothetical protein E4T66_18020 [Sinimarinibacterium sp. CAU 1509]
MKKLTVGVVGAVLALASLTAIAEVRVLSDEQTVRNDGKVSVQFDSGIEKFLVTASRHGGATQIYGRDASGRFVVLTHTGTGWFGTVQGVPVRNGIGALADAPGFTGDVMLAGAGGASKTSGVPEAKAADQVLDILFLYTHRAAETYGLESLYASGPTFEAEIRAAFRNSGLSPYVRVVGFAEADVTDPVNVGLRDWYPTFMQNKGNADDYRAAFGADLVIVLRGPVDATDSVAGVASVYSGGALEIERENAYTVIDSRAMLNDPMVAVHQIGHLLGGGHESPERGWLDYSSAHSCSYADALDGGDSLSGVQLGTAVSAGSRAVPIYSTPGFTDISGTPCGNAATGDNTRTFRDSLAAVTNYSPRMPVGSVFYLVVDQPVVEEGAVASLPIRVTREDGLDQSASVEVATVPLGGHGAVAGVDYGALFQRVEFAAGEYTKALTVPIYNNAFYDDAGWENSDGSEQPRRFAIVLRYPLKGTVEPAYEEKTVFILDDEDSTAPTPTPSPTPTPVPTPTPTTTPTPAPTNGGGGGDGSSGGGALGLPLLLPLLGLVGLRRRIGGVRTGGAA